MIIIIIIISVIIIIIIVIIIKKEKLEIRNPIEMVNMSQEFWDCYSLSYLKFFL